MNYKVEKGFYYSLVIHRGLNLKKYYNIIEHEAIINNLNVNLLFGFIILEQINRGNIIQRIIEYLIVYLVPQVVIKRDMSLGLAQIKLSTAQKIYPYELDRVLIRNLINEDFNISTCAKLLCSIISNIGININLLILTKNYLTGNSYSDLNNTIILYHNLLYWSVKQQLFDKCKVYYRSSIGGGAVDND